MEIALIVLIFGIICFVFPFCFYKSLDTNGRASVYWMFATLASIFLVLMLGLTGVVTYG